MQNSPYTPAFSPPAPSPANSYRASPAGRAPVPLPPPQRSHRAQSTVSQARGVSLDDPVLDARRAVALLVGVDGQSGLLARLEDEAARVCRRWEGAYEDGAEKETASVESLMNTVNQLLSTLQSSVGGFSIPSAASANLTVQERIQLGSVTVPQLFQDRLRIREGADIAGGVIGSV